MGILMDGVWHGGDDKQIGAAGWEPRHEAFGGYVRARTAGSQPDFPAEGGRYHLILCPGCPMSHRVAMVHRMKNLGNAISTSLVRPVMGPHGREFGAAQHASPDSVTGHEYLYRLYLVLFASLVRYGPRSPRMIASRNNLAVHSTGACDNE